MTKGVASAPPGIGWDENPDRTPLDRVAQEVGRRFGRVLEVQDEALRARRISGTFEDQSFEEVVLALCETVGAECSLTDAGATLGR